MKSCVFLQSQLFNKIIKFSSINLLQKRESMFRKHKVQAILWTLSHGQKGLVNQGLPFIHSLSHSFFIHSLSGRFLETFDIWHGIRVHVRLCAFIWVKMTKNGQNQPQNGFSQLFLTTVSLVGHPEASYEFGCKMEFFNYFEKYCRQLDTRKCSTNLAFFSLCFCNAKSQNRLVSLFRFFV